MEAVAGIFSPASQLATDHRATMETDRVVIKYEMLEEKLASRYDSMFAVKDALIEVNPGKVLVPPKYKELGQRILDFQVRTDDVWMLAYPRTGSTWTLEMVWCIINNLDFEAARSNLINFRSPIIELTALFGNVHSETEKNIQESIPDSVGLVESLPSPRCVRSHMPITLLPKQIHTVKPKIVYVARNPKDVCVSYYHYCKLLHNLHDCSFQEFCELFLDGKAPVGPYLDHVLGFWKIRNEPNVLFLKYEDMIKDKRGAIIKMADFLGKGPLDEGQITALLEHSSFDRMRRNPAVNLEPIMAQIRHPRNEGDGKQEGNKFIRKGEVGDWRNHMSQELSARFDQWADAKLAGTQLTFDYQ